MEVEIAFSGAVDLPSLTAALKGALPGKVAGASTFGDREVVVVVFFALPTQEDIDTATAIVQAHNPVFVALSKTAFQADETDTVTVTVRSANPVTLSIDNTNVSIPLIDGVGTLVLKARDPGLITIAALGFMHIVEAK